MKRKVRRATKGRKEEGGCRRTKKKWKTASLLQHSLGAVNLFAASFPRIIRASKTRYIMIALSTMNVANMPVRSDRGMTIQLDRLLQGGYLQQCRFVGLAVFAFSCFISPASRCRTLKNSRWVFAL